MLEKQRQSQSSVASSNRDDNTRPDTADRAGDSISAPLEIDLDLGIDPAAYQYESWSEMADGWVESLRSSVETMPNPDHEQIRNVTPLVPLSDVEVLIEWLVLSGEAARPHEHIDAIRDTSLL